MKTNMTCGCRERQNQAYFPGMDPNYKFEGWEDITFYVVVACAIIAILPIGDGDTFKVTDLSLKHVMICDCFNQYVSHGTRLRFMISMGM